MPRHPVLVLSTEAIMAQAISLGDMLKAKLAEKQQPIQLRLF
jgi:hypothetical protein